MSDSGITRLNVNNFNSHKIKIKEKLQNRFGSFALKELEIASVGTRPDTRHDIRMNKSRIEIVC